MLGLNTEVYSVDSSKEYYKDIRKKTGYLVEECKKYLKNNNQAQTIWGLPQYIDDIGKDIDFLL